MAENPDDTEKTEEPSQKKLEDAHKKGDVAKSQEVNSWFVLFGTTLVIAMFAPSITGRVTDSMSYFLQRAHEIPVDPANMVKLLAVIGLALLAALALPFIVLWIAALAGNLVQHRLVLSGEPIKPKLSRISPAAGFKRLFSATSLVNFAKGLAKLGIIAAVMFAIVWPERGELAVLVSEDPGEVLPMVRTLSLKMLVGVLMVMAVVAVLDFAYQRHSWHKKQKMTLKELRDEYKQMEGDPAVRAKIRQIRVERGRKRMMANVPRASVVIANPTHYAVALQYEDGMAAPVCLAKGIDAVALRIRAIAEENAIPVIENPPLARTLHAGLEIDQEIPPEHYQAVAKVISYIMQQKRRGGWKPGAGR
jgi:flagellar biosynthetic protein FlhB